MILSIVIPTIGRMHGINRIISQIRDTCSGLHERQVEVIIADNSVEGISYSKITPLGGVSLRIIKAGRLVGASAARNSGAKHSNGKWLFFIDDDDFFSDGFVPKILNNLNYLDESTCYVTDLFVKDSRNSTSYTVRFPDALEKQRDLFFKNIGFSGQNILIARKLFFEVGAFDAKLVTAEDRDLGVRLILSNYKICNISRVLDVSIIVNRNFGGLSDKTMYGNLVFFKKWYFNMTMRERIMQMRFLAAAFKYRVLVKWR